MNKLFVDQSTQHVHSDDLFSCPDRDRSGTAMCRFARQNCLWQETVENMKTLKKEGVSTHFIWSVFISCPDRLQNYTLDMELQKVWETILTSLYAVILHRHALLSGQVAELHSEHGAAEGVGDDPNFPLRCNFTPSRSLVWTGC